jgi:hypothetical protein
LKAEGYGIEEPAIKSKHIVVASAILTLVCGAAGRAGEIGHFAPGVANMRDYIMPEPGFYAAIYNYYYASDDVRDANGTKISSIHIPGPGPGPGLNLSVNVDVGVYALTPMLIWVSDWEIAGAKYGAYIAPYFGNTSLSASLSTAAGRGISTDNSTFAMGDMFVQPFWLGWDTEHCAFTFGYGFYAPIGRYNTETVTFPVVGPVRLESDDNIGQGYWTHQLQAAGAWYPAKTKATAVIAALTYETNGEKDGFDLTAGDVLTLNWGVSQMIPLAPDLSSLLEVGPAGYSSWQITDDSGSQARNPSVHDQVHGVGGQLGFTHRPWLLSVALHGFYEFHAEDRFRGWSIGVNVSKKF